MYFPSGFRSFIAPAISNCILFQPFVTSTFFAKTPPTHFHSLVTSAIPRKYMVGITFMLSGRYTLIVIKLPSIHFSTFLPSSGRATFVSTASPLGVIFIDLKPCATYLSLSSKTAPVLSFVYFPISSLVSMGNMTSFSFSSSEGSIEKEST